MKKATEILSQSEYSIDTLRDIMALLRSEEGCPWDREQTHSSIRKDFIEETYEVIEAIDKNDSTHLREELGDVLLQVVFHSQIEDEKGSFTFDDVVADICEKLIRRHPHIFSDVQADTGEAVLENWDRIKKQEKIKERTTVTDELRAVPPSLPALMKAQKIGKKAGKVGFDFADAEDALKKVYEEANEVAAEIKRIPNDKNRIAEEIGDLLLSVTNVARFTGVDCEDSLNLACDKFIKRFEIVENEAISSKKHLNNMSVDELLEAWDSAKKKKY